MYRLLIVDDEVIIADGLREIFSCMKDVELDVYATYSARTALEFFSRNRVDIIMCDVMMPGMNGLQLLTMIKEQWPMSKVIMLTGRSDFDSVYQTIQYPDVRFLLKTEGYEKIKQAVRDAVKQIEMELSSLKQHQEQKSKEELFQASFLQNFWNGILHHEYPLEEALRQLPKMGIAIDRDAPCIMLVGRVDNADSELLFMDSLKLDVSVLSTADSLCKPYMQTSFSTTDHVLVWLFSTENKTGSELEILTTGIKGCVELIQDACWKNSALRVSFVIDETPLSWYQLLDRWNLIKSTLYNRLTDENGMFITKNNHLLSDKTGDADLLNVDLLKIDIEKVLDRLNRCDQTGYNRLASPWMEKLNAFADIHSSDAQTIYLHFALILQQYIYQRSLADRLSQTHPLYQLTQFHVFKNWECAANFLAEVAGAIFSLEGVDREKRTIKTIDAVKQHINGNIHLADEVTLVRLAEISYLSPSYLSYIFRKEVGVTITSYIAQIRVKKAKQLLTDRSVKVQNVALACGYADTHNFSRFFKKETNMTPREYQDTI